MSKKDRNAARPKADEVLDRTTDPAGNVDNDGPLRATQEPAAPAKRPFAEVVADYTSARAREVEALKPRATPPEVDARELAECALARRLYDAGSSYAIGDRVVRGRRLRDPKTWESFSTDERAHFDARRYYLDDLPKPKDAAAL